MCTIPSCTDIQNVMMVRMEVIEGGENLGKKFLIFINVLTIWRIVFEVGLFRLVEYQLILWMYSCDIFQCLNNK